MDKRRQSKVKKFIGMGNGNRLSLSRKKGGNDSSGKDDQPNGEELDKIYKQVLEELAIPESKRAEMIAKETDARKWDLIKQHSAMIKMESNAPNAGDRKKGAAFWVELISRRKASGEPVITVSEAGELYAVLRTAHKKFLEDFIQRDGVDFLIDLTRYYTGRDPMTDTEKKILPQIMSCYKPLMNNNMGMDAVLNNDDSITTFALGMDLSDTENLQTAQEVVMLLAVTCFYSPEGRERVVEAMEDLRKRWREKKRFQSLVETFDHCSDNEFRASVSMLITTVVNSASLVEDRVRVRNDFLALDIIQVFERVLEEAKEDDDESYAVIATQYQVFADMLSEDHREVTFSLIAGTSSLDDAELDLSEQKDVFDFLYKSAQSAGCTDLLLDTTQSLLLIPSERSLAGPTWQGVAQFVREATDYQRRGGKKLRLNFQVLSELLDKRAELDGRLAQLNSGEDIIGMQRQKIKDLEQQLKNGGGRSSKTKKGKGKGKGEDNSGPGTRGSTSEEVKILKDQLETMRNEISELKKLLTAARKGKPVEDDGDPDKPASGGIDYKGELDETGLAPAGLVPGVKSVPIPACPQPNMPGSLELAPIPAKSGDFKSKKKKAGKGAKPDTGPVDKAAAGNALGGLLAARTAVMKGSEGMTAPAASASAAPAAAPPQPKKETEEEIRKRLKLPRKKQITPSVKMKHIYWTPISVDKLEGTVWPELSDQRVKFDPGKLEKKFSAVDKASEKMQNAKRKSLGKIHLVTGKRQQNVGISLSKIRASDEEIAEAIWTMDETMLTPEHVTVLLTAAPTEDEIELVKNFESNNGDIKNLAREDKFLRVMSKIPRLSARLQAVNTMHTFDYDYERIHEQVNIVRAAINEIAKSSQLQTLLEIVLAIGNYLNGGTPRGGAWGFKLDALAKLDQLKDNSGKITLMDFLYGILEKDYPKLTDFSLSASHEALQVSLSDAMSELNQLASRMRAIKAELEHPPENKKDRFSKAVSGFEVKGSKRVSDLQTRFEKTRSDFLDLARQYAEVGAGVEPESFFSKFVKFEIGLKRAKRAVLERREREERARKLAAEKKKLATLQKQRSEEDDDGVFAAYAKANEGNAEDILQGFLQRNRQTGTESRGSRSQRKSDASVGSNSSGDKKKKKKKKVKIIRQIGPDGEVIIKKVKMKKKKPVAPSVPAADFDIA